ncbi:hypothetical protein BD309DRAFT_966578 [Dichomitus squalens]|uniref:Uncharacterized protein n=1 Tax=Dichomitus squalens TaxID=114155 RepID=A0A4Q9PSN5_9APHY|nr:uncharacterized protein DICSQDRAFT_134165 [Dichomitus squalens LYAD-421 SS1]EJF63624.1 hypothetical protein DICSQDRAFT_134165 [Dichomitus squalens LYAD-421 SS1]TBU29354.1 hypothetical protein BD311DRAFT_661333 [Dichomitus squalens]TBU40814.1 hypothetical protein BD309DRAFT_966578 [Dichomitus squalens]TBU57421.1 hypothetical protein BD310DRAFT_821612 [Dichomitus squalens]
MPRSSAKAKLHINELALALDLARAMVDVVDQSTRRLASAVAIDRVRRKCPPQSVIGILHFVELATWEFQTDPSLHGKVVEVIEAHRVGRLSLRKTLLEIAKTCPRAPDFLSFLTVFLPLGWTITLKRNPEKNDRYDAFAIVAPGPRLVRLVELDPPVIPRPLVRGQVFGQTLV